MDDFILALGWVGVYAPLALGAVGSMVGVSRGGMAACGALLEVESGYGRFIGVSAMPSSQTIYGIVVMLTLECGCDHRKCSGYFCHRHTGWHRPDDQWLCPGLPPAPRRSTPPKASLRFLVYRLPRQRWLKALRYLHSCSPWYWRARFREWEG